MALFLTEWLYTAHSKVCYLGIIPGHLEIMALINNNDSRVFAGNYVFLHKMPQIFPRYSGFHSSQRMIWLHGGEPLPVEQFVDFADFF